MGKGAFAVNKTMVGDVSEHLAETLRGHGQEVETVQYARFLTAEEFSKGLMLPPLEEMVRGQLEAVKRKLEQWMVRDRVEGSRVHRSARARL